jgi:2-dehydro-3-deoxyglucarate aldolase/4-hydroxy-2-oxoheptanedioate aldolase
VINLSDATITEVLANTGYDFLWIDGEHSSLGLAEVSRHVLAARSYGVAPFVRIPWNDPVRAKPILEMGPAALVFPFVNSSEDAANAVAACRYPPKGIRGFGPQRANLFGREPLAEYMSRSEQEPWVVLQIEHVEAVNNLEAICEVEGIGSLLVGPFDLSSSIGRAGQLKHPDVTALFDRAAEIANQRGVLFGAFALADDEETIRGWLERGASWLALDTDMGLLRQRATQSLERVREIVPGDTSF